MRSLSDFLYLLICMFLMTWGGQTPCDIFAELFGGIMGIAYLCSR